MGGPGGGGAGAGGAGAEEAGRGHEATGGLPAAELSSAARDIRGEAAGGSPVAEEPSTAWDTTGEAVLAGTGLRCRSQVGRWEVGRESFHEGEVEGEAS